MGAILLLGPFDPELRQSPTWQVLLAFAVGVGLEDVTVSPDLKVSHGSLPHENAERSAERKR